MNTLALQKEKIAQLEKEIVGLKAATTTVEKKAALLLATRAATPSVAVAKAPPSAPTAGYDDIEDSGERAKFYKQTVLGKPDQASLIEQYNALTDVSERTAFYAKHFSQK